MSDEDYRKIFHKKLSYYMQLNNKSQTDLVNDLGISQSTISNWCTGLKLPRMGKIQLLADYFGVNKSDLIEEKNISAESNEGPKEENNVDALIADFTKKLEEEGLILDGKPAKEGALEPIIASLQVGLELAKNKNK